MKIFTHLFKFKTVALIAMLFFVSAQVEATHFRYGTMNWEIKSTGPGGTVVEFNITQSWRASYAPFGGVVNGGTENVGIFQFGDGATVPLLLTVTDVSAEDWFVGSATLTHTYATGSPNRIALFRGCCRISTLQQGNANDEYIMRSLVTLSNPTNNSPVASTPPIYYVATNQISNIQLAAFDPDGDALTFSYSPAGLSGSGLTAPIPTIATGLTSSGILSLNTTGIPPNNRYATQVIVRDANGAYIPLDFVIQIVGVSTPPVFNYPPTPANATLINVGQGNLATFTVQASDVDPGNVVNIFGTGIPVGATFVGTPGNPASYTFSWTPTGADLGAYVIAFTAQDNLFSQANTSVTVFVVPCSISATAVATDVSCTGSSDGAIDLTLGGNYGTPTLAWTGPGGFTANTEDISGLVAGSYTVTATGDFGLGCSVTETFVVGTTPDVTPPTAAAQNLILQLDVNGNASIGNDYSIGPLSGTLAAQNSPSVILNQSCNCPTGYVAVGYEGFAGCITDNFRLICKELNPDGTLGAATAVTCFSGGGTTTPFTTSLTGNNVLVGFNVTDVDYQYSGTRILLSVQGIGKSLAEVASGNANNMNNTLLPGLTGAGCYSSNPASSTQYAPNGNVIVGMEVLPTGYSPSVRFNYAPINQVTKLDNGSTDNCGIASIVASKTQFTCSDLGDNTVTLTVTDLSGNTASTTATVTVQDNIAPIITCPADIISDNDPGKCDAVVSFSLPSVTDNCLFPAENLAGFTTLGVHNGNTYYLSNALFVGPDAFADAVSNGGFLASINSATENAFVRNAVNSVAGGINILIGFNDVATEGTFVWQNGDPVSYTNWNGGEPNDAGGEDYTQILASGYWNDVPGSYYTYRYILKLKGTLVQTAGLSSGSQFPSGETINTFLATDAAGNTATCSFTVTVNNTLPVVTIVTGPATPVALGNSIGITISHNDDNLTNAAIDWDDLTPLENITNPSTGSFDASHTYATPGIYTVSVTLTDACSEVSETYHYQYVVIYDPNGGFVTGGGWFNSPECAYKLTTGVTGKANFGFVAKYKKGSTVPDGNTQFQFKAGDINFHSSVYDDMRLVIANHKANYTGTGTINGTGNYGFLVSAIDGQIKGDGIDKFRIKIWDKDNGNNIVYDNNCLDTDENSDPATAIGGGSIVIHSSKTKSAEIATAIEPEIGLSELKAYPNPFSDKLFFEFSREEDTKATLILFDGVGRKISVLFDQQIQGNQNYRIEYVPNGLSTNMLFYRMTFDNEVINGKVIYKK